MCETALWSGLPLTLILPVVGMAFAFPLAILLALGRRSELPAVRVLCVAYIELVRGVPLITVLFMASVMLPLFLPTGLTVDKLLRAQVAFILFAAAYLAEVVRGGLQAIPRADRGGRFAGPRLLAAHPADRAAAGAVDGDPAARQQLHRRLQEHVAGHHHRPVRSAGTANAALTDPNWQGFAAEAYVFAAAIYFCFCFFMSRYSQMLERKLNQGRRR